MADQRLASGRDGPSAGDGGATCTEQGEGNEEQRGPESRVRGAGSQPSEGQRRHHAGARRGAGPWRAMEPEVDRAGVGAEGADDGSDARDTRREQRRRRSPGDAWPWRGGRDAARAAAVVVTMCTDLFHPSRDRAGAQSVSGSRELEGGRESVVAGG